jgi:hypothetical protein
LPTYLAQPYRLGNRREDESGVPDGGKRNEVDAIDEMVEQSGGNLRGQPCFADAAWPRERKNNDLFLQQQVLNDCDLMVTTDEGAAWQEQVAA